MRYDEKTKRVSGVSVNRGSEIPFILHEFLSEERGAEYWYQSDDRIGD